MFAQLDRIDIVAEGDDGVVFVQTDHRSAEEVAGSLHLSMLLAMARLQIATEAAARRESGGRVVYAAVERPPDALCRAIAACGASLEVEHEAVALPQATRGLDELVDESMRFLADEVLRREELPLDEPGLIALQKRHQAAAHDREEAYWTAFLEIAAVAGEVVRALDDTGRWVIDDKDMASVPFIFDKGDNHLVNICGRAQRSLDDGWQDGPHVLLGWLREPRPADGPTMLNLKPASWGSLDVACRPLLDAGDDEDADIPIIAYGTDTPSAFAYKRAQDGDVVDLEALHAAALQTLAEVRPQVQKLEVEGLEIVVVSDDYYAAEKLLDVAFMTTLHAALGTPVLAASVPAKGLLFVATALSDALPVFMGLTRQHFDEAGGSALSPTVFVVSEGSVVGRASIRPAEPDDEEVPDADPQREAEPADGASPDDVEGTARAEGSHGQRKPWWKRWFGL